MSQYNREELPQLLFHANFKYNHKVLSMEVYNDPEVINLPMPCSTIIRCLNQRFLCVCNSILSTRRSLGEQKAKAEAQTHQLQEEMNQLKQQLQQDQQKLISYQEMQCKEREEYARSVSRLTDLQ